MQGEREAARATSELLRSQIVTKVKAVAEHEAHSRQLEARLSESTASAAELQDQLQVCASNKGSASYLICYKVAVFVFLMLCC